MKIVSAQYIKSFLTINDFDLVPFPSIAFIGRSNVGKSSLINSLLNRKKLVKTSSTPGKTQMINYFIINEAFYFVDLPGYGFAKVPIEVRGKWFKMIEDFLMHCPDLRLIIQLVDIRHPPSKEDILFQELVRGSDKNCLVIANKVDKIKRGQIERSAGIIKKTLSLSAKPLIHSIPAKIGQEDIWASIQGVLGK